MDSSPRAERQLDPSLEPAAVELHDDAARRVFPPLESALIPLRHPPATTAERALVVEVEQAVVEVGLGGERGICLQSGGWLLEFLDELRWGDQPDALIGQRRGDR